MKWIAILPTVALLACGTKPKCDTGSEESCGADDAETLADPPGAPDAAAVGRLTCVGKNDPGEAAGATELTGYVRTLADPDGNTDPPSVLVEAFEGGGAFLEDTTSDAGAGGRVFLTVPTPPEGFTGYLVASHTDFLEWRFENSRPVVGPEFNGWAFLATPAEADAIATDLGTTRDPGMGQLVGSIHDCDGFGVENAVITVEDDATGVGYIAGFAPDAARTYTGFSGRFLVPNLQPGSVTVKAFGRLEEGGPLTLLSRTETTLTAGGVSAVALQPRISVTD